MALPRHIMNGYYDSVDLDEYFREGNRDKIHNAESTENTGRAS